MPFACIFVPDFPVEALLRAEPELRAQGFAVLEGKAPLQKVFAVNKNARRAGVACGMTKLQVEACVDLVLRARSPLLETAAHAALLDCAQSFSPRVEDTAPDTIVLDLAGLETLFGPLPKMAEDLARRASGLGLEAQVAVAGNPDAAVLAARGFSGVTVIPEGKEAEQLSRLLLEVLFSEKPANRESEPILGTLHRWGMRRLGELARLPEIAISERLGQRGLHLQKLARGTTSRPLVPFEPPLVFEEAIELEYPLVLLEPLACWLSRMLEQLCARLRARALATQELRLALELQNGHPVEVAEFPLGQDQRGRPFPRDSKRWFHRTLRLPVPLLDSQAFLKLLQLDLKAHPPGAPIHKIHLAAEPTRPRAAQNGLFLPPSPEPEKLELTLAKIAGIVGGDRVGSLALLDTHRPEGFRMQPFVMRESPSESGRNQENFQNSSPEREGCSTELVTALRMFRPPLAASVTLREGNPTYVSSWQGEELGGEILWAAGPWRSSGDWWEKEGWARDEWDIAVQEETQIVCYRLVRDLLRGRWLLEGTYD
jgi:protein ImuB